MKKGGREERGQEEGKKIAVAEEVEKLKESVSLGTIEIIRAAAAAGTDHAR